MDHAAVSGIAACGVINSNHFGAGALYARMAAERGMIGIAMTNVKPLIVAPGASVPVTGNNPIASASLHTANSHLLLDMSLSVVAGGKLTLAIKKKEKIPMDWQLIRTAVPPMIPRQPLTDICCPWADTRDWAYPMWWTYYPA